MKTMKMYTSSMHLHVRYYVYEPKVVLRVKGIVQIHHGLGEHADLYDHFASFLLSHGFVVVVSDFPGHGKSLIDFEQGYFGEQNGPDNLIKDIHHLLEVMRRKYPDVPYFMLGFDFGSVLIRKYASQFGDYIEGIMLLGTIGSVDYLWVKKAYLYALRKIKGPIYKAHRFFEKKQSSFNKKLNGKKGSIDWMIKDTHEQKKFLKDPMTHFAYTVQGYRDILSVIKEVNTQESIQKMPDYLSVYVGYGAEDPMRRGIWELGEKYKKRGFRDLTLRAFLECRHSLLFEKNKKEVYQDVLRWLDERTYL